MIMFPMDIMSIEDDDDRAFMEQLYLEYASLMMSCAMKILKHPEDASDAVEQAVVHLINHLQTIRKIQCSKLRPYVVSTIKNVSINIAIKRGRESRYSFLAPEDVLHSVPDEEMMIDDVIIGKLRKEALMAALKKLPSNEQEIIRMKYLAVLKDQEIARTLQLSPSSVRVYLTRARRHLYNIMRGTEYEG